MSRPESHRLPRRSGARLHHHQASPPTLAGRQGEPREPGRGRQQVARRYEAVIEMAPDATVVVDAGGRIRLVNRQTEVLFGYAREELLGQQVELLIPERFHQAHHGHRAAYMDAPRTRPMGAALRLFGRRRDGSEFPVEVSLGPLQQGGESLVIASVRDITEVQRVQAANQELRRLQAVTDTALAHLDLDDLLPELLARVHDVMAVDNAAILLLDEEHQELRMRAASGPEAEAASSVKVPLGEGFAGRIAASREPLIVDDTSTYPVVNPFLREQVRSVVGVPLLLNDRVLGVLHVGTAERHRFTAQDVQLLERVAERIATAIERAQWYATEQRARAEAERQARLLEQSHDAIFVWEWGGGITYWNHGAERLYGWMRHEAAGKVIHELLRTVHPQPLAEFLPRLERAGEWTGELLHTTRDGQHLTVLSRQQLVRQADGHAFVLESSVDITDRKWLERERAEARASELAVREINQHLDEFFRTAAHDLRQPLTVAKGHAEMALRRFDRLAARLQLKGGKQATQAAQVLATLQQTSESINRATQLTVELFDVARARTGTLEIKTESLELGTLVREQVAEQRMASPGREIRLETPDPAQQAWVLGDGVRLRQVLTNYLTNALKYSDAEKPVEVRLEVVEHLAVVSVRDEGPGLPWEEQGRVWEMLHRAPGVEVRSGSEGSLGMGLYIVKRLMELHPGGRAGVESVVGEGSTFWFRLPLATNPPAEGAAD